MPLFFVLSILNIQGVVRIVYHAFFFKLTNLSTQKRESTSWRITPGNGMKNSGQSDHKTEQGLTIEIISVKIELINTTNAAVWTVRPNGH